MTKLSRNAWGKTPAASLAPDRREEEGRNMVY